MADAAQTSEYETSVETDSLEQVVQLSVVEEIEEVEQELGEESQEEPEPRPAPTRRNGRPGIPSFDEIIQGTKSESDDE